MSLYNIKEINLYNEELKRRFISEKIQESVVGERYWLVQFNYIAEYEREYNKDVCNFSLYEILEYLKMRGFSSLISVNVAASLLSTYTDWCLQNNLINDCQNHFLELNQDLLNNTINKAFLGMTMLDRETFLSHVREIINPRDQFVLMMLFETGKSKDFEHIFSAQFHNYDQENHILKWDNGRVAYVSDELDNIILNSNSEDVYYSLSGNNAKKTTLITLDDRIMKCYPNQTLDTSTFQQGRVVYYSCVRSLNYLGLGYMNANSIVEAGKVSYINHNAKQNGVSAISLLNDPNFVKKFEQQFHFKLNKQMFIRKNGEFLA